MKKLLLVLSVFMLMSGMSFGQVTVSGSNGTDGTYATLTNAAGAFLAINGADQSGKDIVITITADVTTEAGTNSLNAGLWKSIAIKPSGARIVSGTVAAPLINLNGANKLTIDGLNTGGNSLTFSNLSTAATSTTSTIRFIADASNNTITNCSILGSSSMALGTNGGNIFFSTGTTTGNDNNTISNCKIGPAGSNLPSKGIYGNGSTTSSAIANSGITINNCEIYDFFLTSGCAGIYALTGNTDWTITNNKIYQSASRTFTAAGTMSGIYFANATYGNNIQITGNTIGYANNAGTGTLTLLGSGFAGAFQGIYLSALPTAATACNINTNIISDISLTSSSGTFYGINNATTASTNTINLNSNTVRNIATITTTGTMYGIYTGGATTISASSNTINNITRTGSGLLYGIGIGTGTTNTVSNNTITNLATNNTTSTSSIIAIYTPGSPVNITANSNIINNLSTTSTAAFTIRGISDAASGAGNKVYQNNVINTLTTASGTGTIYGIYTSTASTPNALDISGNTLYTFSGATTIYAINQSGASTTANLYKNKIYDIAGYSASALVYGIYIGSGTTLNIYNNIVGDLRATAATGLNAINGIYGSATSTYNVYYNTVYLNATSTSVTTFGTSCVYFSSSVTAFNQRNNILVNLSTPALNGTNVGTNGISACLRRSGGTAATVPTNYSTTSNNNDFWCNPTAGTNNHLSYVEGTSTITNAKNTVADLKTFMVNRDQLSFAENPPFLSTTGSSTDFLHISTLIATQVESGCVNIATFTDDFDGNIRQGNPGYTGTGTAPDVGADEFNGIPLDLTPPTIVYTPLPNTSSTASRSLVATITDASGVGDGANQPVLYWKINSGAYTGPVAPTTIVGSSYTFNFGSGVVAADVVSYFIVAQDKAPSTNICSYPAGATVTANPPLASAGPPSPSTYLILGLLCGNKTVGATGADYPTLTAAFAALNASQLCGPIVFTLLDATYPTETYPLVLNSNPGSSAVNTVTFKINTGVTTAITGTNATGPLIKILNNYTIIDGSNSAGGTTRNLTISNIGVTTPNVIVINSTGTVPVVGVTVQNCILINGSNGSSAVVITDVAGTAGYFNNITLQNNSIQLAYIGIYALATVATGNGSGLLIKGNDMNTAGANSIRLVGIYVQGVDGVSILNNQIANIVDANAESPKGIWLATGTNTATVSGNTIGTLSLTNTGAYALTGIYVNPGATATSISIANNTISNLSNSGTSLSYAAILSFSPNTSITGNIISGVTQNAAYAFWGIVQSGAVNSSCSDNTVSGITTTTTGVSNGINIQGVSTGVTIARNKIFNVKNTNSGGYTAVALALASTSTTAGITVANNFIYDIAGYGYADLTTDNGYGINIYSGGGYNIYYNSINLATNQTSATGDPACLIINSAVTTAGSLNIRDNIFAITSTIGTNRFAVISNAANTVFSAINYNDYYFTGPNLGYIGATNRADLAAWKVGTGQDANSISGDPKFVTNTDLHIQLATISPVRLAGTPIAGITTDIDGETRNVSTPDIGADESIYTPPAVADPVSATATAVSSSEIDLAFVPNLANNNVVIVWNLTGTFAAPTGAPPAVGGSFPNGGGTLLYNGLTSPAPHTGLIANTLYYYKVYSYDGTFYSPGLPRSATTLTVANPTSFAATAVAKDEIDLSWVKNTAGNDVMVATNSTSTFGTPVQGTTYVATNTITGGGTVIYIGPATGFNHTGLTFSTQYFYKAFSVDAAKNYSSGTTANAITMCDYSTITGTTPGSRCGTGTVSLAATSSGGTLKWYAAPTGGTSLGAGSPFTTPVISANTNYYVAAETSATGPGNVTIGTGSSSSTSAGYTPYYTLYESSKNQILFLASELTAAGLGAGNITSLALNLSSVSTMAMTNFTVSLGTTSLTALTTTYETGLTSVFTSASYTPAGTGWQTVTFTTPFAWNGTSNLIVQICEGNNTGYTSGSGVYYSTLAFNCHHYGYQDAGTGCAMTTPSNNYVGTYRPNMIFGGTVTATCASPRSAVLATVNTPPALTVSPGMTICNNTVATLAVVTGGSDFDTYIWSPVTGLFEDLACSTPYTGNSFQTVYFKSATGGASTFTCTASKVSTGCSNIASSIVTNLPGSPVVTPTPATLCLTGTSTLTTVPATGYGTATFQWQNSTDNATFADISGATALTYTTATITTTTYYKLQLKLSGNLCSESNVATVTVNNPLVLTTTPASRCGTGTVTLGATATAGATLNWFPSATSSTSLGTGPSFTTPVISATTPYWAEASSGGQTFNVGLTSNNQTLGAYGPYGMYFASVDAVTINSIDIYPAVALTLTISMTDAAGVTVDSRAFVITAGDVSTTVLKTLTLGFHVPAGAVGWSLNYDYNINRGSGTYTYPYTNNGFSITGNSLEGNNITAGTRYYYYNWVIYKGCAGPRVEVDATVNPAPAISASATLNTICAGGTTTLSATSGNSSYVYSWAPATTPPTGTPVNASPVVSTMYTVTGTDNSGGTYNGCASTATVYITANPVPSAVTASSTLSQVCTSSTPFDLSSSSNSNYDVVTTYLSPTKQGGFEQGLTFISNGWTEINGASNNWYVGTAAGAQDGVNAAYVGINYVGVGFASVNHFYQDFIIPSGVDNISLQFYLKMPLTDNTYDYFNVYTTTTDNTPVAGTLPGTGYTSVFSNTATAYPVFTLKTVALPASLAGTTVRLVFTYKSDGVTPYAVPAVDYISLTSSTNTPSTYLWTSVPTGFTSTLQNIPGVTQSVTTQYIVTAQNLYGCSASAYTTVTNVTSASIVTDPAPATKCTGETATFTVVASGPDLTYQWRKNLIPISIAVNPSAGTQTLSLANVSPSDATTYDVVVTASCGAPVTSAAAALTVNQTPTGLASSNSPLCVGSTLNLTGTTDAGTAYSWTGPNGFTSTTQNPSIASVTLSMGGTYSFTATMGGCSSPASTTTVVVNPLPGTVTITPSAPTILLGDIQMLTASGGDVTQTLLSEDFNGTTIPGWASVNNSTGGDPTLAAWMLYVSGTTIQSNDNTNFVASNSDAQGSGGTTDTELITPSINTTGFSSLSLSFWHYYYALYDEADIEVSEDGGTTWLSTPLISYTTTQGTGTVWAHAVVNLSAYVNQANLKLRFHFLSSWGYYWCIDNVSITGIKTSSITWLPVTDLFTNAGATTPYVVNTPATTVYAKPSATITYTATATATGNCTSSKNVTVTVTSMPTVTTDAVTAITSTTATSGGNVTSSGGISVTARGVCWSTSANPTTADSKTTDGTGTGTFVSNMASLTPGTTYHVRAYATNTAGTAYGSDLQFTTLSSSSKTLNLTVFLESLYNNGGIMFKAQGDNGDQFPGTVADQITVELHDASTYATIIYSAGLIDLNTNGTATVSIPSTYSGSYYLTIKHRNSIEITSGAPVSFADATISYDYSTNVYNTYGENLKAMGEGIFGIYGGDVNQDGIVDSGDMNPVENASTAITFGYVVEDVNGDGIVDSGDMNIVENNSTAIIMVITP